LISSFALEISIDVFNKRKLEHYERSNLYCSGTVMRFKGRLKEIYEFLDPGNLHYYDLFCDHGGLGIRLLESTGSLVTFNDEKSHLIDSLIEKVRDQERASFEVCRAQELIFEKQARVVMAGVGGLTMISCFESWLKTHQSKTLKSLEFYVSPHYYGFELWHFLHQQGFRYDSQKLIQDGKHIYEVARVKMSENNEPMWPSLDKDLWSHFGDKGQKYLSFALKNLSNKSELNKWESQLLAAIKEVLV